MCYRKHPQNKYYENFPPNPIATIHNGVNANYNVPKSEKHFVPYSPFLFVLFSNCEIGK